MNPEALETLALLLYESQVRYYRDTRPSWLDLLEPSRNRWRNLARGLIKESYYTTSD